MYTSTAISTDIPGGGVEEEAQDEGGGSHADLRLGQVRTEHCARTRAATF